MAKSIGMIEYTTVSTGIRAADTLVKTAEVEIIEAQVVCPGKYIVIISGELSAIQASIEACKGLCGDKLIDSFVLGNVHEGVFPAIYATVEVENPRALGVLETFSGATAIVAADAAAKSADVTLVELRIARGMCGKSYLLLTGEVAAVSAAIENAQAAAGERGMLLDSSVIPNPDPKLWEKIL